MITLDYRDTPGWCAGCKVHGITETTITHKTFPSIETILQACVEEQHASVAIVSVNEEETRVLEWLLKNKFRKGPSVRNWNHGGRKTFLYFKQIPERIYEEFY